VVTGRDFTHSVAVSIDLEDGDRILDLREVGIQAEHLTKLGPGTPVAFSSGSVTRNNSGCGRRLCSTEVMAESIDEAG